MPAQKKKIADERRLVVLGPPAGETAVRDARARAKTDRTRLEVGSRWYVCARRGTFPAFIYDLEQATLSRDAPAGLLNVPADWIRPATWTPPTGSVPS